VADVWGLVPTLTTTEALAEVRRLRAALELIEAEGCSEDVEGVDLLCSEVDPIDTSGWCAACLAHEALGGHR
jgi:hypothetical protein